MLELVLRSSARTQEVIEHTCATDHLARHLSILASILDLTIAAFLKVSEHMDVLVR